MKKRINKSNNILTKVVSLCLISLSAIIIYRTVNVYLDESSNGLSDQVWCQNCQTYHDRATAEKEEEQKLVWCVNCNTYHLPGADE